MAVPARQLTPPPPDGFPGAVPILSVRCSINQCDFAPIAWREGLRYWATEGIIPRIHHADISFGTPRGNIHLHLLQSNHRRGGRRLPFLGLRAIESALAPSDALDIDHHVCVDDLANFGIALSTFGPSVRSLHLFSAGRQALGLNGHIAPWHLCIRQFPGGPRISAWRDPPSSR